MVVVDGQGIPLGSILASASPAEVKLAEQTLDAVNVPRAGRAKKRPKRLSYDYIWIFKFNFRSFFSISKLSLSSVQ
jgi:hypothetical protein